MTGLARLTLSARHELLYKELSYELQGAAMEIRKNFGPGHKESIYQNAFAEELDSRKIPFEKEKAIKIYSPKTGKFIGLYRPDFLIDGKIIVEVKSVSKIPKMFIDQLFDYLRNSEYELGYFINFASPKLYIKRIIFTNDRKFFRNLLASISVVFVLFSVWSSARAATLYAGSAYQTVVEGQTFVVDWFVDTQGKNLNTLDLRLRFLTSQLEVMEAGPGQSILNLWIQYPEFSNTEGLIHLIGGATGGFRGHKIPVFRTVLKGKTPGPAKISMEASSVALEADGRGTPDTLVFQELNFTVATRDTLPVHVQSSTHPDPDIWYQANRVSIAFSPAPGEIYSYSFSANPEVFPDGEPDETKPELIYENLPDSIYYFKLNLRTGPGFWQEAGFYRVQIDATAPEEFSPIIFSDPDTLSGKPFLNFSTIDKTSGLSHYRVKVGFWGRTKIVSSPYVLSRPLVGDKVTVTAVDQAGNNRPAVVDYPGVISVAAFGLLLASAATIAMLAVIWKRKRQAAK